MLIAGGTVAIVLAILAVRALVVVPTGRAGVVERFGKYHRTVRTGMVMTVPLADRIRFVDVGPQRLPLSLGPLPTADGDRLTYQLVLSYEVTDPVAAAYQVADLRSALEQRCRTALGELVGGLGTAAATDEAERIGQELTPLVREAAAGWGAEVERVEVPKAPVAETRLPSGNDEVR